jgi:hypothetical protein
MAAKQVPTYADSEYQAAHDETFSHPLTRDIESVLPPGVSPENFGFALKELTDVIGQDAVFTGEDLKDYVDPYEIPEAVDQRKVPCAAVW